MQNKIRVTQSKFRIIPGTKYKHFLQICKPLLKNRVILTLIWISGAAVVVTLDVFISDIILKGWAICKIHIERNTVNISVLKAIIDSGILPYTCPPWRFVRLMILICFSYYVRQMQCYKQRDLSYFVLSSVWF